MSDQVGNQNVGFLMTRLIFVFVVRIGLKGFSMSGVKCACTRTKRIVIHVRESQYCIKDFVSRDS